MLREFFKTRRKSLFVNCMILLLLFSIRSFFPEAYFESRFTILGDIALTFGIPLAIFWEWREFKKEQDKDS